MWSQWQTSNLKCYTKDCNDFYNDIEMWSARNKILSICGNTKKGTLIIVWKCENINAYLYMLLTLSK